MLYRNISMQTSWVELLKDLKYGKIGPKVSTFGKQMLFSAIVALNITCLVCLLKHQTKKADCGVAAWHQFRQIRVHIELDIATQADTTLLRLVSDLLVSTLDTHLSSCSWCLEKSNWGEIVYESVFSGCASNLLVA